MAYWAILGYLAFLVVCILIHPWLGYFIATVGAVTFYWMIIRELK